MNGMLLRSLFLCRFWVDRWYFCFVGGFGAACRMTGREDLVVNVAKSQSLLFIPCQRKRMFSTRCLLFRIQQRECLNTQYCGVPK